MQTSKSVQAMSAFPKIAVQIVSLGAFYALLLFTITHLLDPLIYYIAPMTYVNDSGFKLNIAVLLLIYVLFCYVGNNFVLNLYERPRKLIISMVADYLIMILAIILTMFFNRVTQGGRPLAMAQIYNIYIVTGLQIIKIIIGYKLLSPKENKD